MKIFFSILGILIVIFLLSIFIPITFRAPATSQSGGNGTTLFKTEDGGNTWQSLSLFPGGEINKIVFDKNEPNKLLVATLNNGMWLGSRDDKGWQQYHDALGPNTKIFDILESATANSFIALPFSENRGEVLRFYNGTQNQLLFSPVTGFAYLKGHVSKDGTIRVISSDGGIYQSNDSGIDWRILSRFQNGLLLFEPNASNEEEIWAATGKGEFYHSQDGGISWENQTAGLSSFPQSSDMKSLYFDNRSNILYMGSSFGLVESSDHGRTWTDFKSIIPPVSLPITSIVTDPQNSNRLVVGTQGQIYFSNDFGLSWEAHKVPGSGAISSILIDPKNSRRIFIGFKALNHF